MISHRAVHSIHFVLYRLKNRNYAIDIFTSKIIGAFFGTILEWECLERPSGAVFITCSHSGIVRIVVNAILCILLFGADWTEWKTLNHLAITKWLTKTTAHSRQIYIFPPSLRKKTRGLSSIHFSNGGFSLFDFPIVVIIPISLLFYSRRDQENAPS